MKRLKAALPDLQQFGDGCERERGGGGMLREIRLTLSVEINKARRREGGIH